MSLSLSPSGCLSFQGSQHSGSSLSLASTKVCSSMDEGDGLGIEGMTFYSITHSMSETLFANCNKILFATESIPVNVRPAFVLLHSRVYG